MNNAPWQPNFQIKADTAGLPSTEYDNLSEEDLVKAINDAYKLKTGRTGSLQPAVAPPPKNHVDLDAMIAQRAAK